MNPTTIEQATIPTAEVRVGDLVRIDDTTEIEVNDAPRRSLFGHGWMISGYKVVNGIPERCDFLHQTDADTVTVWR